MNAGEVVLPIAVAVVYVLLSALLSRLLSIRIEANILIAGVRGIVQLLLLASVLLLLFSYPVHLSISALFFMLLLAGYTAYRHATVLEGALRNSVVAISLSALLLVTPLFLSGIFPMQTRFLIPLGSIVIGNCMNTCSLAIDRYLAEIRLRRSEIEAYLCLGAPPRQAAGGALRQSLRASLIPTLDNMKNLGLIWIPGIMTGMLITGEKPYLAAGTQIVLFVTILLAGLLSSALLLHLSTSSLFNKACQLKDL